MISYLEQSPAPATNPLSPWGSELSGWSNTGKAPWPYQLKSGDDKFELSLEQNDNEYLVKQGDSENRIILMANAPGELTYSSQGIRKTCRYKVVAGEIFIRLDSEYFCFEDCTHKAAEAQDGAGSGQIKASMDGAIIDVQAEIGMRVEKGQTLVILEAMKMEHPLKSDVNGTVEAVNVTQGDQVKLRQLLVSVTPDEEV